MKPTKVFLNQTVFLLAIFIFLFPVLSRAQVKEIISEGTYNMGDGETPSVAEERALLQAKRVAVEQTGTYVESYSKVINLQLTEDEIQALASGLMEVDILDKKRSVIGDGIHFWVKIKSKVNLDKTEELANRIKAKDKSFVEDYKKIQEAYKKGQKEIEELKKQLHKATSESDRAIALESIKYSEGQYNSLKVHEKNIYSRLFSTESVLNIIDQKKSQWKIANDLITKIANGIHIDIGTPDINLNPGMKQQLTEREIADMTRISIPLTIRHSDTVWKDIDSTIMRIGGKKKNVIFVNSAWKEVGNGIVFQIGGNYETIMAFQKSIGSLGIFIEFFSNKGLIDSCQIEPHYLYIGGFNDYPVIRVKRLYKDKYVKDTDLNIESVFCSFESYCNFDTEEYVLIPSQPVIINAKLYMRLEDVKSLQKINAIIKQVYPRDQMSAEEKRCW